MNADASPFFCVFLANYRVILLLCCCVYKCCLIIYEVKLTVSYLVRRVLFYVVILRVLK